MVPAADKFDPDQNTASPEISREFPFTEPLIVASPHIDGFMARTEVGVVHFVGWQTIEPLSEGAGERRIVLRFAMSEFEARAFRYILSAALREGH